MLTQQPIELKQRCAVPSEDNLSSTANSVFFPALNANAQGPHLPEHSVPVRPLLPAWGRVDGSDHGPDREATARMPREHVVCGGRGGEHHASRQHVNSAAVPGGLRLSSPRHLPCLCGFASVLKKAEEARFRTDTCQAKAGLVCAGQPIALRWYA